MQQYTSSYIIRRLLKNHIRPYFAKICLAVFFMAVVACCAAVTVKMVQPILDEILFIKDKHRLLELAAFMLVVSIIKGAAEFFQNYIVKALGQGILTDLQILLFEHLLHADLALLQKESSGKLISRFTNDIMLMRGSVSTLLVGLAKHLLTVLFLIILMFKTEPRLSVIVFVIFPLAIYPIQYIGRRMRKTVYQTQDKLGEYTAALDEVFLSIKVVKSYNGEDFEVSKAKKITSEIYKLFKKATKFDALTSPVTEFLSGVAIASILIYGGFAVINNTSTPGALFTFITAFFSAYRPFKSMLSLNVNLQEGMAASGRLFQILDTKPKIIDSPNSVDVKFAAPGISFKNVSLSLNDKNIFEDLNLNIQAGKTTAVVGESGSGKTSIVNLLLKFYQPNSGQIVIEDKNLADIKIKSLREQIALVTQETFLFDTSVLENIIYTTQATKEEALEAAKKSSAYDFIMELPNKYDTLIGFQGYSLSGGQRQRLSLARAFLKRAPILILDEATSSLDAHNEGMIFNSLKKELRDVTTIIITHRLASIQDVDDIIVINNGKVVEQGSHQSLIEAQGEYYRLYEKQAHQEL